MRRYQVISGDGHIEGPIDFTPYIPGALTNTDVTSIELSIS